MQIGPGFLTAIEKFLNITYCIERKFKDARFIKHRKTLLCTFVVKDQPNIVVKKWKWIDSDDFFESKP